MTTTHTNPVTTALGRVRTGVRAIIRFFVDDGAFAATILFWIAIVTWLTHQSLIDGPWQGPMLAAGIMIALIASIMRACYTASGYLSHQLHDG